MVDGPSSDVFRRLVDALSAAGIQVTQYHHEPVYTSVEAAAVRGTDLHSGAKALVVKGGDEFVLAVMPADLSLDGTALRKHLGCKRLRFATGDEVMSLTGLTPGSIPPFGSLFGIPTICDQRLADNSEINFNAGSHTDSIQMEYQSYIAFESPQLACIAKPPEPQTT